ncbi:DBH-like monooxygenase protein 1 homolog [Portunus trituberculatus]|uniref:DBH-like monooxygenase protein 1 homolog n=1 Tax=Portunus trituberculatus TaxID=210409 RepID=UPI001E1CFF38|nr:DBH-like monooxygenase protein 1 homolog [Portunus trituberculatus]XP_045129350.1 DBH-like monooxygenase protein 1 homolog [Portunus trituberculatus]XP_045129351.1 DBH-like monooxygenase protein 1 homolog [Portunus trituberculatus]XP_045129352.1 DBH-like monooxygenase protein 1 homolog [Portunus trituberculatus]
MQIAEVLLLAAVLSCRRLASHGWQQEAALDDRGDVRMYWTVDVKKNVLLLEIQGRTLGYVAMGISLTGTMKGADLLIGYVDYMGKPHVLDYWADKNGPPILDNSQDWKLLTGRQNDTHTMVRVRRPITPNTIDDINVVDEPTWILWAWHPHDPGEDLQKAYHKGNRGKRKLCLLRTKCWPPPPVNAVVSTTTTTTSATHFHLLLLLPALLPRFL